MAWLSCEPCRDCCREAWLCLKRASAFRLPIWQKLLTCLGCSWNDDTLTIVLYLDKGFNLILTSSSSGHHYPISAPWMIFPCFPDIFIVSDPQSSRWSCLSSTDQLEKFWFDRSFIPRVPHLLLSDNRSITSLFFFWRDVVLFLFRYATAWTNLKKLKGLSHSTWMILCGCGM